MAQNFFGRIPQIGESFSNLFAWIGGSNMEVYEQMPSPLKSKHSMFGFFLMMIVLVQAIIAGLAWSDLLHSAIAAVLVFIFWIFTMGALDRALMVFMNQELALKGKYSWLPVISRIIIIGFVSYLNSTMAEIRIFDPEIKKDLVQQKELELKRATDTFNILLTDFNKRKNELQKESDNKRAEYLKWSGTQEAIIYNQQISLGNRQTDLVKEIEGTSGSKQRGDAQVAAAKRVAISQDSISLAGLQNSFIRERETRPEFLALQKAEEIQKTEFAKIDEDIDKAKEEFKSKKAVINTMANDGFSHRYKALGRIGQNSALIWVVWGFFFFIELSLLIIKIMMGRDSYHDVLKHIIQKFTLENVYDKELENERKISEYEKQSSQVFLQRIQQKKQDESYLNSEELSMYPIERKRILDQFEHARDMSKEIDKVSDVDFSVKNLFKFNFYKKLLRLQPSQSN